MTRRLVRQIFSTVFVLASFGELKAVAALSPENFVGAFAEPADGGNVDTRYSTFDGTTVVIVPRSHPSETIGGGTRWRNVLFALRGVQGKSPTFCLPLTSPSTGRVMLAGDTSSYQNLKLVWSYDANAIKWNTFDSHVRSGTTLASWKIEAKNETAFTRDVVYVSINEHFPVTDFYDWLATEVFTHPWVRATPSEAVPGTFVIGYQSGAAASAACSREIPDVPLYGFVIRDPAAHPSKLVVLVSGQHPYEGQNKVALQGAVDWILNSSSTEAKAYRATYLTVVYPFVNPSGELAGLWRGTAAAPAKDCNRNWGTTETDPARDRGIDTVIVHKNAMKKDIAAFGLGEPYALFDYHQNYGDHPGAPDYVLHATGSRTGTAPVARRVAATEYAPFYQRLAALATIADMPSDLNSPETLRGYMLERGAHLPITFERSVNHSIASELSFGTATVKALVEPAAIAAVVSREGAAVAARADARPAGRATE